MARLAEGMIEGRVSAAFDSGRAVSHCKDGENGKRCGRQDKRTASFAAVCGRFSMRYAYDTSSRCQPLTLFRFFL
jgi:hypothetical protein